jgi:hypothetical protein
MRRFAESLATTNPRFNAERFINAWVSIDACVLNYLQPTEYLSGQVGLSSQVFPP